MRIEDLRDALAEISQRKSGDPEGDHRQADELLLEYIGDREVERLFDLIRKWYS